MSLAWATIAILVLLLPGIFFLIGLFSRERYSREAAFQSPVLPIAFSVTVAAAIHLLYLAFLDGLVCEYLDRCVNLKIVLSVLTSPNGDTAIDQIAKNFSVYRRTIPTYLLLTTAAGYVLGLLWSAGVVKKYLPSFCQHRWIRDIVVEDNDTLTWAYVLTKIEFDGRIIMYRGAVKEFFATSDGTISYLILANAMRYYMVLDSDTPNTTAVRDWKPIGEASRAERKIQTPIGNILWSNLLIEGSDITNVLFERTKAPKSSQDIDSVRAIIKRRKAEKAKQQLQPSTTDAASSTEARTP